MTTLGPLIFVKLATQVANGTAIMRRSSPQDKEYFVQDWIRECLGPELAAVPLGRNSHPDFSVTKDGIDEGLEAKSLENRRLGSRDASVAPCRTDVDFNSCIPCGQVHLGSRIVHCYYAFVLYESIHEDPLLATGVALVVVDGNFLNRDFALSASHANTSEGGLGSYGDAFVRTRKMYSFPNPLTRMELRYKNAFVTEDTLDSPEHIGLRYVRSLTKTTPQGETYPFYVYELA